MSYRDHAEHSIAKKVRNRELVVRLLILIGVVLFAGNLYVNSYTLVKVNGAVETVQDCVEVKGECYQERINSSQSSTSTVITAMAAIINCNNKSVEAGIPRTFEGLRACVFDTIDMAPVERPLL